jgi:high-affinity Fe2+/Pb2+ permease
MQIKTVDLEELLIVTGFILFVSVGFYIIVLSMLEENRKLNGTYDCQNIDAFHTEALNRAREICIDSDKKDYSRCLKEARISWCRRK